MFKLRQALLLILTLTLLSACKEEVVAIDKVAPSLAVINLQGQQVGFDDYPNTVKYVFFWSRYCGGCLAELPILEEMAELHHDTLSIISINIDNDINELALLSKTYGLSFEMLQDQLQITQERYRIVGTPTAFIVDKQGIIREAFQGMMSHQALRKFIQSSIKKYY